MEMQRRSEITVTMKLLAEFRIFLICVGLLAPTLGSPFDDVVKKKLGMNISDVLVHGEYKSWTAAGSDLGGTWKASDFNQGAAWFDIATSSNGRNQTAIASPGGLYLSYDYGQSWNLSATAPVFPQGNTYYQAVASSATGQYLAAAVSGGPMFVSRDYGATWVNCTGAPVSENTRWYAVAMSASGQYMGGVVMGGYVYISKDYGEKWTVALYPIAPNVHGWYAAEWFDIAISASGQHMITVAGDSDPGGGIYYSSNYGYMFDMVTLAPSVLKYRQQWVGVAMNNEGDNVTVVNSLVQGGVFTSTNYGETFQQSFLAPNISSIGKIGISGNGKRMALYNLPLGAPKQMFLSEDGGETWNTTAAPAVSWTGLALTQLGTYIFATAYADAIYSYVPNCPAGSTHNGIDRDGNFLCTPCPAGTYADDLYATTCTVCDSGTYSTTEGNYGEWTCEDCTYPWTTKGTGDTKCPILWFNAPLVMVMIVCAVLAAMLVVMFMFGNDNQLVVVLILAFPALDALTDLAYLLISRFYNLPIFIFCVLFFLHPTPMFLYKLYKYRALPHSIRFIWWLGYSSSYTKTTVADALNPSGTAEESNNNIVHSGDHIPYPTILGRRFSLLVSFEQHDNLYVVILELLTWVIAVVCQMLTLVALPAFLVLWLVVGVFLQMTKTIAMGNVWNVWFYVWTGHTYWQDKPGAVDTEDLNYGLLAQFCLETVPHIILQSLNNTLLGTWVSDPIAIFSLIMSIFMAVATIYKYIYHVGIRADPQGMKDVPLDRSVSVKIFFTNIEYKILNALLVPHSRNITIPTNEQLYYRDQKRTMVAEEDGTGALAGGASESASLLGGSSSSASSTANTARAGLTSSLVNPVGAPEEVIYASAVFAPVNEYSGQPVSNNMSKTLAPSAPPTPVAPQQGMRVVAPAAPLLDVDSYQRTTSPSPYAPPAVAAITVPYNPPSPTPSVLSATAACPPELICPITQRIMTDPVMCSDGYTYERVAIEQHFRSQQELLAQVGLSDTRVTSPTTKEQLASTALIPNRSLAALLAKFYASQES